MKLVLLGTTGYHPSDRRHTPCMLLPECGIAFDAGTASYRIGRFLETDELDFFLTHAHLDHVIGLTYLFAVLRDRSLKAVRVHGKDNVLAAIEEHLFADAMFPKRPPFEACPLEDEVALGCGGRLKHFPLEHRGGSTGYRIDWPGRSMAYVTDTTAAPDAAYVDEIRGVDLLVHECYFPDGQEAWATTTGHSCTTPVAQVAKAAGVGRLVLVHLNPQAAGDDPVGLETARAVFPATELGYDLMALEF